MKGPRWVPLEQDMATEYCTGQGWTVGESWPEHPIIIWQVLHAGQRLAVELPEVEELRAAIRRCEWNEAAKRVMP